jgi:hypothetical protein
MCQWGNTRVLTIKGKSVDVDACIADLVQVLNNAGIETVASCCGHGNRPGDIALKDGWEIILARDYAEARRIDTLYPDIHGGQQSPRPATGRR